MLLRNLIVWIVGFRYIYLHERVIENWKTPYKPETLDLLPLNPTYGTMANFFIHCPPVDQRKLHLGSPTFCHTIQLGRNDEN